HAGYRALVCFPASMGCAEERAIMKLIKIIVLCLFVAAASLCIAQQVTLKPTPIKYVDPSSGKDMYVAYCASCHGADGMGTGPAASALKAPPTDLTMLAHKNSGTYPAT